MSDISVPGSNATLSYSASGKLNTAKVRVSMTVSRFSLVAEESHARQHRAFYPHRRSQGEFSLKIDSAHWVADNALQSWFREYAAAALNLGRNLPPVMYVEVPSRTFRRYGIPTSGIRFGDHIGSNVFSPVINFVSVSDPDDPTTSVLDPSAASRQTTPGEKLLAGIYPQAVINSPGGVADELYTYQQYVAQSERERAAAIAAAPHNRFLSQEM